MSGEQHLADARREAEEALRRVLANAAAIVRLSWSDGATAADCANMERIRSAAADIAQDHKVLRSLLAAPPPRPAQDAVREAAELAHLDLLSYDEAVTGNEKRHALSRCKNALRDVLRTIDAALDAAKGTE